MNAEELKKILDSHALWLDGEGGKQADLIGAYLYEANLSEANLSRANLSGAYLRYVNLSGADLSGADLSRADLRDADLRDADLSGADLSGADLSGANLSDADLRYVNLSGADLSGADLSGANLSGCTGIILLPIQDPRGFSWPHAVQLNDDTWRIRAGCRFFTLDEAKAHWGPAYERDRERGDMYLYAVEWLERKLAKMGDAAAMVYAESP